HAQPAANRRPACAAANTPKIFCPMGGADLLTLVETLEPGGQTGRVADTAAESTSGERREPALRVHPPLRATGPTCEASWELAPPRASPQQPLFRSNDQGRCRSHRQPQAGQVEEDVLCLHRQGPGQQTDRLAEKDPAEGGRRSEKRSGRRRRD